VLKADDVLNLYKRYGAFMEGHFLLSSGLHSRFYLQSAQVLQYPSVAEMLCASLAEKFLDKNIDIVIAPAVGGIIVAHEVARKLSARAIFAEREKNVFTLRRGFFIDKGEKVAVVEDVVTTGGSVEEVVDLVKKYKGEVVGIGALVDRSRNFAPFVQYNYLLKLNIENYKPKNCPLCKEGITLVKPGSKKLRR
jgi:orotate phosphoribosyltransferase